MTSGRRTPARHLTGDERARAGAFLLLAATLAAIVWANVTPAGYDAFWSADLHIGVERLDISTTLQDLVNDALMTVFFFAVGLDVRREFAIGELSSWSRAVIPTVAAIAGLSAPAVIYILFNLSSGQLHAWGAVISTDTAFLMGALALVGPRSANRLRVFLLALAVVDDIGALTVIALAYTADFSLLPLIVGLVALAGVYATRFLPSGRKPVYAVLWVVTWSAFLMSGIEPTLAGVAIALLMPVTRPDLHEVGRAVALADAYGDAPTRDHAVAASRSLRQSVPVNDRLQASVAPYVAYLILPLFALANAGITITGDVLAAAWASSVTWGIVVGLVAGKFIGVFGSTVALKRLGIGDFGPGLNYPRLAGGSALCGMGFTISLFIIQVAITDPKVQDEARIAVLGASVIAFVLGALIFRPTRRASVAHDHEHAAAAPAAPVGEERS